ncbi:MAG: biotin--[acetyl-CoA-carboxylase] ligase [Anaerolineae bacterium]|nr:biotin--[acetyl-CoA-carboxylase] ligase [Anaerolineae bacterium]
MSDLSQQRIQEVLDGLDTGSIGAETHFFGTIGSTNDEARRLAESGAPEGTIVVADEQKAGRGRFDRVWEAPRGSSILLSVIFRPTLPPDRVQRLVMACGLAVIEACEALATVRVDIKWPNDLQIGGKKLCGILPESALIGSHFEWVVVGMGINVTRQFEPPDPLAATATSLQMETGRPVDRGLLLGEIMRRIDLWHNQLEEQALLQAWIDRCVTLGRRVQTGSGDSVIKGVAEAIDETGALLLRDSTGELWRVAAGEATLLEGR